MSNDAPPIDRLDEKYQKHDRGVIRDELAADAELVDDLTEYLRHPESVGNAIKALLSATGFAVKHKLGLKLVS